MTKTSIPAETRIGHVHLKVADLERAIGFYRDYLGFDLLFTFESAAFLSAGGYHHHIGLNTWESKNGSPPSPGTTGLYHFAINYPTRHPISPLRSNACSTMDAAIDGASDHGTHEAIYLHDPDFNGIELAWDRHPSQWPRRDGAVTFSRQPLDFASLLGSAWGARRGGIRDGFVGLQIAWVPSP